MIGRVINNKIFKFFSNLDWGIVILPLLISFIGLTILFSAGLDPETGQSIVFKSQATYYGIGWGVFLISALIPPRFWKSISPIIYIISILLLLYLTFKGGVIAGGARRWISLGPIRLQPSEVSKVAIILFLSRILSNFKIRENSFGIKKAIMPIITILIPAFLIIKQPDLGTGLCLIAIGGTILFISGISFKSILMMVMPVVILSVPIWQWHLKDYQKQRVITFISPEKDPLGRGYHSIQSRIAVGSGAIYGKGFTKGTQTQLRFLPEQTTDFIFSVLAEEWGFIGSLATISLYALLVFHLLQVGSRIDDLFSFYVTIGTASLIFWHTFINIGMVIGVLPVVGITLAMLSYGGSSLVTTMWLLGMVAGFSSRRYLFS